MPFGKSERWQRMRAILGLPDEWLPPMAGDVTLDIPANLVTEETKRLIACYHRIEYQKVQLLILRIARTICLDDVANAYPSKNQQYRWLAEAYFRMPPDMQPNFLALWKGFIKPITGTMWEATTMGHKIYIRYEEANHPQTPRGAFFEGLFAGTLGFMTTIGGWLVSLFCWLGLETQHSAALALAISVYIGVVLGLCLAHGDKKERKEICKTK